MNDQELLRFCSNNSDLRIEREPDGEILVMSPVDSYSGSVEAEVGYQLSLWARADGRGKVFGSGAGFKLPDSSVRAASAAWLRFESWNALTRREQSGYGPTCPEFIIQVASAYDRHPQLEAKMKMWIANGTELAWLIHPGRRVVRIYRPHEVPEVHRECSSIQGTGLVSGFELVLK